MEHGVFVHAIYSREADAAKAIETLVGAAFASHDISALMLHDGEVHEIEMAHHTGMATGAALGAVFGALGGALVATGGVLVAGPLLLALEGAFAGGALGTLAGTLGGLGYWREEIDFPDEAFEGGAVLIGVSTAEGRVADAKQALLSAGATEAHCTTKAAALHAAEQGALRVPNGAPSRP